MPFFMLWLMVLSSFAYLFLFVVIFLSSRGALELFIICLSVLASISALSGTRQSLQECYSYSFCSISLCAICSFIGLNNLFVYVLPFSYFVSVPKRDCLIFGSTGLLFTP